MKKLSLRVSVLVLATMLFVSNVTNACTGICLIAKDSGVVYGRSMEWGAFDLNSRVTIVPRGYRFVGSTPDGFNGKKYSAKYGYVALDMLNTDAVADGMNENGLSVGMFYFSGAVEYAKYEESTAGNYLTSTDVAGYILAQYGTVEDVKEHLNEVLIVGVVEPLIGITTDCHWMVNDKKGNAIVIEVVDGKFKILDAPLRVITNKPSYDWQMTNIRNYINLSDKGYPNRNYNGVIIKPTGHGTGLLGMPGDNTPVSRFVRATIWVQQARELDNAKEGIYETLRILDNFQLPLGPDAAEGGGGKTKELMRSSTIWTTAWNLTDLTLNYHTQHNRRTRQLDIKNIDFGNMGSEIVRMVMDKVKKDDYDMLIPKL